MHARPPQPLAHAVDGAVAVVPRSCRTLLLEAPPLTRAAIAVTRPRGRRIEEGERETVQKGRGHFQKEPTEPKYGGNISILGCPYPLGS